MNAHSADHIAGYRCCAHCADDPVHAVGPDRHEVPCNAPNSRECIGRTRVTSPSGHEQVHRPATGDSVCTCGQWVGPMTTIPASDPRSFAVHVVRVTSPGVGA